MRIIFVGNKRELLASLIPDIENIHVVNFSSNLVLDHSENHPYKLIIVDLDNITVRPHEAIEKLSHLSPTPNIWAYYSQTDCAIRRRLLDLGFDKVFSYEDNIIEAIKNFAYNT